jgi:hypothetical protein
MSVTSSGSAAEIVICIDFVGATAGYISPNSAYVAASSTAATAASPTLTASGSPQAGDMILWAAGSRTNGTNTVSQGTLMQAGTVGSAAAVAVYYEVLAPSFPTAVT